MTSTAKRTYVVWPKGKTTGDLHKDAKAVIEVSGAVCIYKTDESGQDYLVEAYAPGTWDNVRVGT